MALFIGGPLDGQLLDVEPDKERVQVSVEKDIGVNIPDQIKTLTDVFYYKRELISCTDSQYAVYVPKHYNCDTIMKILIDSYSENSS